jgi:transposase
VASCDHDQRPVILGLGPIRITDFVVPLAEMKTAEEVKPRSRPRAKRIPSAGGRFRISDELWALMEPLLPEHKNTHRFGGGRPRVPDRPCADAIFFVLRTGCQWNALSATGLCPSSTAHDRFGGLGPGRQLLSAAGRRGWPSTTPSTASTGVGFRWRGR